MQSTTFFVASRCHCDKHSVPGGRIHEVPITDVLRLSDGWNQDLGLRATGPNLNHLILRGARQKDWRFDTGYVRSRRQSGKRKRAIGMIWVDCSGLPTG